MNDAIDMSKPFATLDMVGEFYGILQNSNPELASTFEAGAYYNGDVIISIDGEETNSAPDVFVNKVFPVLYRIYSIEQQYKLDVNLLYDVSTGLVHGTIDDCNYQHAWKEHTPNAIKTEWESLWLSIYDVTPASVKAMLPIQLA
jgi:hypothetical protein